MKKRKVVRVWPKPFLENLVIKCLTCGEPLKKTYYSGDWNKAIVVVESCKCPKFILDGKVKESLGSMFEMIASKIKE